MGGAEEFTSLPEEVRTDVETLIQGVSTFLDEGGQEEMTSLTWIMSIERAVINGIIPLPCTLTEAGRFLGQFDTTSLLQKGTDER
jgi:hypothetical protein